MESTPIGGKVEFETSGVLVAASCELVKGDIDVLGCRDESDEIIQPGTPRKKLRLSIYQSSILEQSFREHSTISPVEHLILSACTFLFLLYSFTMFPNQIAIV